MSSSDLVKIFEAISEINSRLDEIQLLIVVNKKEKAEPQPKDGYWWSVQYYKNSIVINNYVNNDFRLFIKEIGATWLSLKKGWMFPKSREEEIISCLIERFPNWELKDQREQQQEE